MKYEIIVGTTGAKWTETDAWNDENDTDTFFLEKAPIITEPLESPYGKFPISSFP